MGSGLGSGEGGTHARLGGLRARIERNPSPKCGYVLAGVALAGLPFTGDVERDMGGVGFGVATQSGLSGTRHPRDASVARAWNEVRAI